MAEKRTRKPKSGKGCMNHAVSGRRLEYRVRDWFKKQKGVIEVFRMAASRGSADLIVVANSYISFVQVKKNRPGRAQIKGLEKLYFSNRPHSPCCEVHIVNRKVHEQWYFDGKDWREYESNEIVAWGHGARRPKPKPQKRRTKK
jgi:hypothetical protein